MNANEIIRKLRLIPHPKEGGFFLETYRSEESIPESVLSCRYERARSHSTAIYYLLTPDSFSEMHRLKSDEVFHFYCGDPVEMLQISPDATNRVIIIGNDVLEGEIPQVVVQKDVWQGCRLKDGGKFALMGCTVAPGFDYEDYESAERAELIAKHPQCADMIIKLTR